MQILLIANLRNQEVPYTDEKGRQGTRVGEGKRLYPCDEYEIGESFLKIVNTPEMGKDVVHLIPLFDVSSMIVLSDPEIIAKALDEMQVDATEVNGQTVLLSRGEVKIPEHDRVKVKKEG